MTVKLLTMTTFSLGQEERSCRRSASRTCSLRDAENMVTKQGGAEATLPLCMFAADTASLAVGAGALKALCTELVAGSGGGGGGGGGGGWASPLKFLEYIWPIDKSQGILRYIFPKGES